MGWTKSRMGLGASVMTPRFAGWRPAGRGGSWAHAPARRGLAAEPGRHGLGNAGGTDRRERRAVAVPLGEKLARLRAAVQGGHVAHVRAEQERGLSPDPGGHVEPHAGP